MILNQNFYVKLYINNLCLPIAIGHESLLIAINHPSELSTSSSTVNHHSPTVNEKPCFINHQHPSFINHQHPSTNHLINHQHPPTTRSYQIHQRHGRTWWWSPCSTVWAFSASWGRQRFDPGIRRDAQVAGGADQSTVTSRHDESTCYNMLQHVITN